MKIPVVPDPHDIMTCNRWAARAVLHPVGIQVLGCSLKGIIIIILCKIFICTIRIDQRRWDFGDSFTAQQPKRVEKRIIYQMKTRILKIMYKGNKTNCKNKQKKNFHFHFVCLHISFDIQLPVISIYRQLHTAFISMEWHLNSVVLRS